ncbi:PREDICTED: uncharacterized protein C15orf43 homolog [Tinamus guttatus]|uniref:uncharacterized protein C15orf43 homolog n=1 Tax=Tinamus guttatus TaxID=94827 RepID=UPI00052EC88D|nr:PREDICTED: uncharacterized protein C15orf43 homolog [Tinamus guttatus]
MAGKIQPIGANAPAVRRGKRSKTALIKLIHESQDYLDGRATVFHSCYLSAWANTSSEMKQSVVLGHFILPPACLQEEIRRKIGSFIWEQMDESLTEKTQCSKSRLEEPETGRKNSEQEVEDALDPPESREGKTASRETKREEFAYHTLREYPVNNMVTGYPSARNMKKYTGELRDFTPGASGYTAYWIQNDTNIRSGAKNKRRCHVPGSSFLTKTRFSSAGTFPGT